MDMKKFVRESLYEAFEPEDEDNNIPPEIENDEDVEVKDDWEKPEEEDEIPPELETVDSSDMESEEIEVEEYSSELEDLFNTELEMKEFNRENHTFRVIPRGEGKRGKTGELVNGVVMVQLKNGNYVFKTDSGMRKFNIKDIVLLENKKNKGSELNEVLRDGYEYNYVDYLFDIATFLMLNPENVQAIMDIHNVDEEEAKIEITNELEDNDGIYGTKAMFDAGIEPDEAANTIVNQYQG